MGDRRAHPGVVLGARPLLWEVRRKPKTQGKVRNEDNESGMTESAERRQSGIHIRKNCYLEMTVTLTTKQRDKSTRKEI